MLGTVKWGGGGGGGRTVTEYDFIKRSQLIPINQRQKSSFARGIQGPDFH